jgi:tetratricopeptide (TPR) repeat protein
MADDVTPPTNPHEGPGKGKTFFDRAKTVAGTGNYDYAIDMYIEGLNREPFNVEEHKSLRDTALRRKVTGGKPAGGLLGPKLPYKGKTPKEAMLNAEFLLAKDVGNIPAMLTLFRNAVAGEWNAVAVWIGDMLLEANRTTKNPKFEIFTEMADTYVKIHEYKRALEAVQHAIRMKPNNMELEAQAKDIAAMDVLREGNYDKGGGFQHSIKDKDMTKQLLEEENLNRSEEYRTKAVALARAEYEKNPKEVQTIAKYSRALQEMEDEASENIAIEMLMKAFAETQVYRFKADIGTIKIKQFRRKMNAIKDALKADPKNVQMQEQLVQVAKERLAFELEEFAERSERFPTDMTVRYEYGVRLYESKHYDEAIVAFQQAQNSPKYRVDALHKLGRSFMAQHMIPEALDTLKKAIDEYEMANSGDKTSKDLFYWYAVALQENGNIPEAIDIYSKIVRWDIGYRDARIRLAALRGQGPAAPTT